MHSCCYKQTNLIILVFSFCLVHFEEWGGGGGGGVVFSFCLVHFEESPPPPKPKYQRPMEDATPTNATKTQLLEISKKPFK